MKAQSLVIGAAIISVLILFISLSISSMNIYTVKRDEGSIRATLFSFYCQSIAYGTQRAFYEFGISILSGKANQAARLAELYANDYLKNSINEIASKMERYADYLKRNQSLKISSNVIVGENSSFSAIVYEKGKSILYFSLKVIRAFYKLSNASISIYYSIEISYQFFYNDKDYSNEKAIEIQVLSYNGSVNFSSYLSSSKITLVVDSSYVNRILIIIKNEFGMLGWLLA